jgi:hypothetical protein
MICFALAVRLKSISTIARLISAMAKQPMLEEAQNN